MQIKDFIKFLEKFPEDVVVEVAVQKEPHTYQSYGQVDLEHFVEEDWDHWGYVDFTGNKFVTKESPYYNLRILELGSSR
jgi:hypothetical protein